MPSLTNKICAAPGCYDSSSERWCPKCKPSRVEVAQKQESRHRASAGPRPYDDKRWRPSSLIYLGRHPLCVRCEAEGRIRASQVTDHIIPWKLGGSFWDQSNWQALCKPCHDGPKAQEDAAMAKDMGVDLSSITYDRTTGRGSERSSERR